MKITLLKKKKNGPYKEYPISSILYNNNNLYNRIINKLLWKTSYGKNLGDGISSPFIGETSFTDTKQPIEMVSIELFNINKLSKYKSFLRENSYMQFISHPKMISKHNLDTLSIFLKHCKKQFIVISDWKKITL